MKNNFEKANIYFAFSVTTTTPATQKFFEENALFYIRQSKATKELTFYGIENGKILKTTPAVWQENDRFSHCFKTRNSCFCVGQLKHNGSFTLKTEKIVATAKNVQRLMDLFIDEYGFKVVRSQINRLWDIGEDPIYVNLRKELIDICLCITLGGDIILEFASFNEGEWQTTGHLEDASFSKEEAREYYKEFMQNRGLTSLVG